MRISFMALPALVALTALAAPQASAEDRSIRFGVEGNWSDDADLGLGARVELGLSGRPDGLAAVASFNYYFPGAGDELDDDSADFDASYWEANANLIYTLKGKVAPYFGTGLNIARASVTGVFVDPDFEFAEEFSESETAIGVNIIGGVRLSDNIFAESKLEIGGGEMLVVTAGFRF